MFILSREPPAGEYGLGGPCFSSQPFGMSWSVLGTFGMGFKNLEITADKLCSPSVLSMALYLPPCVVE